MSEFSKAWKIVGGIGVVAAVIILSIWLGGRGTPSADTQPIGTSTESVVTAPAAEVKHDPFFTTHPREQVKEVASANPANPASVAVPATTPSTNLLTNWEEKVDQILTSDGDDSAKAKQMLEMFAQLPEDGQVEVAQHISNLTPDQDYPELGKLLTNSALPESVLDVLLADTLNRPNSLKLPSLLEVARDPQNPKASDAKDLLQLFLDDDYGSDWNTWQTKMEAWLKDNPD